MIARRPMLIAAGRRPVAGLGWRGPGRRDQGRRRRQLHRGRARDRRPIQDPHGPRRDAELRLVGPVLRPDRQWRAVRGLPVGRCSSGLRRPKPRGWSFPARASPTPPDGWCCLADAGPRRCEGRGAGQGRLEKLAIADPKAAPHGQAAVETLSKLKLYDALKPRIVTGASITQASSTSRPARPSWASWPCRR